MMRANTVGRLVLAASLLVFGALGCAQEREPINRVQADALSKSFFVGKLGDPSDDPEFYWRNFVVDASESQSLIGIGSWSGVDRIRWEITETQLIARKSYQPNPGGDNKGVPGGEPNGTIVAAYPITSHFDIKRAYNPSTGEPLNVIEENTSDRVWNQREYFRVDWTINLVDTPQWIDMFQGKLFGEIKVTPVSYYVNDPTLDDAPHFDPEQGYFDVTSRYVVEPETGYQLTDGTPYPTCLVVGSYTGTSVDNCDPQEATVRSSYWRVDRGDPDGDFEPFENSRASLDIVGNPGGLGDSGSVGIVTAPQITWDPQYGYTDPNMKKFMHVHDIWQKSHQTRACAPNECPSGVACLDSGQCAVTCAYASRRDADNNGTDDQCENADTRYSGSQGSQCSARNRCTIPYRDRTVKPIGFWFNKEMPDDLLDTVKDGKPVTRGPAEDLAYTWNQALKSAVARAREVECRRTGGDRQSCHDQFFDSGIEMVSFGGWGTDPVKSKEDVLVACHNPVRSYDAALCGEPGSKARVGDLRKNFLFYWPYASNAPWGGIGNWNGDPVTGQILGASATVMGRSATMAAAFVRDIIMVANGELEMSDITNGTPASIYQKRLQNGYQPEAMSSEEIQRRLTLVDTKHAAEAVGPVAPSDPKQLLQTVVQARADITADANAGAAAQLKLDALLEPLRGSALEAELVDSNWQVDWLGRPPAANPTEDILEVASPFRGAQPGHLRSRLEAIRRGADARGLCFLEPFAGGVGNLDVQGVARFYWNRYGQETKEARAEHIYHDIWQESFKGIALHEMGHGLGLLHQFTSSYDSTNYNPQYWQLRTQEGRATASCGGQPRSGDTYSASADTCMGPRYLDPETDDELGRGGESRPGIYYFGHTSTMEYQHERFFENVGLGQYDLYAMNALYGRVLETFDADRGLNQSEQEVFAVRNWTQRADDNFAYWPTPLSGNQPDVQPMHYTEAARRMNLYDAGRCRPATAEESAQAEWRVVHGKVCAPPPKDYASWNDFEDGPAAGGSYYTLKARVRNGTSGAGNVRWPYRWGTSNNAYIHTNPFDAGADIYELTRETIRQFDYAYPFRYFRRQSREWAATSPASRTIDLFFDRLRSYHWTMAYTNAIIGRAKGTPEYDLFVQSDDWWRPNLMAEAEMFSAITRALLIPEIGGYYDGGALLDSQRSLYYPSGGQGAFNVDASNGRYIYPAFNDNPSGGGSWDYWSWLYWDGFSIEKAVAGQALTDGGATLTTFSSQNALDSRYLTINFRTDMPDAVDRLIGGLLSSDWESIAPYVRSGEMSAENRTPEIHVLDLGAASPSRPADALLIFPNLGYRQQLSTLTWAYTFARLDIDQTLANKLQIWVAGYYSSIPVPDGQQIRFTNPESGITYVARKYGPDTIDGKLVDKGIASRMLARANQLLLHSYEVERDASNNPILDQYGAPKVKLDANSAPIEITDSFLNSFRRYIGVLDMAVQLANQLGFGPYGGNPPAP
ncbi:MAG TPA: hypothetical protein VGJ84_05175 [Polyangiaceae bacterium]